MLTVRTVAAPSRFEIPKIKGSRFLAVIEPVSSADAAASALASLREEMPDATHHCWAWRLSETRDAWRYSDDGEPSGTAGRPILQEIDGRDLVDVQVTVVRWYGGTKLGTGGLLRAYAASAAAGLDAAPIVETVVTAPLHLGFAYGLTGPVQGVLAAYDLEPVSADYGARVRLELAVPVARVEAVREALTEATGGGVRFDPP